MTIYTVLWILFAVLAFAMGRLLTCPPQVGPRIFVPYWLGLLLKWPWHNQRCATIEQNLAGFSLQFTALLVVLPTAVWSTLEVGSQSQVAPLPDEVFFVLSFVIPAAILRPIAIYQARHQQPWQHFSLAFDDNPDIALLLHTLGHVWGIPPAEIKVFSPQSKPDEICAHDEPYIIPRYLPEGDFKCVITFRLMPGRIDPSDLPCEFAQRLQLSVLSAFHPVSAFRFDDWKVCYPDGRQTDVKINEPRFLHGQGLEVVLPKQ